MELETVRRRVRTAISNLIVEDYRLLTLHAERSAREAVAEPALSAALAWQLKRVFDSSWDVDCEYNRVGSGAGVALKRVRRAERRKPQKVSADIIVHRRGESGPQNNLLFVEVKKTNNGPPTQKRRGGVDTVAGSRADLHYQHGLFLSLGRDSQNAIKPRWAWIHDFIEDGQDPRRDVYTSRANLAALLQQGAELAARRYGTGRADPLISS